MKKLLVSGDSFTSGWPLEETLGHRDFTWPNIVARKLGYELIDTSRANSNQRIYRKAFDGMLNEKIDLAIVFISLWSSLEVGAAYGDKPGRIYQYLSQTPKTAEHKYVLENFLNGYKQYAEMLRSIISLQLLAKEVGTTCYFLNTFDNNLFFNITLDDFKKILQHNPKIFDNMDDDRILDKFNKIKMLTSKIDRSSFISESSMQTLIEGCPYINKHPGKEGHEKIASIVLNFLEEKSHVNKTI